MEKIFYSDNTKLPSSEYAVKKILTEYFGIDAPVLARNENGKPFLKNPDGKRLFFSVSHTPLASFFAFSDENVGIDAESLQREVNYQSILKKFSDGERAEICNSVDFLKRWTVKESVVKWLGGTLARDLYKISYADRRLLYGAVELPVRITQLEFAKHAISVCSERDFALAEILSLSGIL